MGRWFGYRPGYEDLPRIWMTDDLAEDFEFLATVEEELRAEIRRLDPRWGSPHAKWGSACAPTPGRLSITDPNKMHHAKVVQVSFSGQRHQTFILHERETRVLEGNIEAARRLADPLYGRRREPRDPEGGPTSVPGRGRRSCPRIPEDVFTSIDPKASDQSTWWTGSRSTRRPPVERRVPGDGGEAQRRTDKGRWISVNWTSGSTHACRSSTVRLFATAGPDRANIKALLSVQDWVADLDPGAVAEAGRKEGLSYHECSFTARSRHGDADHLRRVAPVDPPPGQPVDVPVVP